MQQFAWLDLFGGRWLLLNGSHKYPARSWDDEEMALADLIDEGWTIIESSPKRRSRRLSSKSRRRSRGYAMTRTIH
jgi:hypothetical protein